MYWTILNKDKEKAGPVLENQSFQAVCGTAPGPPAISLVSPELWIYLCCHGARLKSAPAHILNQKRDLVDTFFHGCRAARHNTYKQTHFPPTWKDGSNKRKDRARHMNGHGNPWFISVSVGLTGVLLFCRVRPGKRRWKDRARRMNGHGNTWFSSVSVGLTGVHRICRNFSV